MTVLVDSNVILDLFSENSAWYEWSAEAIADWLDRDRLCINPIIYAEISVRFASIESLEEALPSDVFQRLPLPYEAGFLAGKCFQQYRARGGLKHAPMPDFYIGAHAAVSGLRLMTCDARRYASYFPTVDLIAP